MLFLNGANKYLLSLSTSILVLTAHSGVANAQQARAPNGVTETFHGPVYVDTTGGGESVLSYGAGTLLILQPSADNRISVGSALADGGGIIAYDTDFTGGLRTGATVIARHQNTSGGAYIDLYNSTITTVAPINPAHASRGLEARHSHLVTMTGGSITSRLSGVLDPVGALTWSGSNKVTVTNTLATIILTDVNLNVSDVANTTAGTGVASVDGGRIFVQGGSTLVVGHETNEGNKGVYATGKAPAIRGELADTPSLVVVNDSSVTVHGNESYGAKLSGTGQLQTNNAIFNVTGDNSIGVAATAGSMADLNDSMIVTSGEASIGLHLGGDAVMNLANTDITSNGIVASITAEGNTVDAAQLTIEGGVLNGEIGVFGINNAFADINLTSVNASTDGDLLSVSNNGDVELNVSKSIISGNIIIDDTSYADVSLSDSSSLTGAIDNADLSIDRTSHWNMTENSYINELSNDGVISFATISGDTSFSANYRTLTVDNYSSNNGTIHLNTHLGDDSSATDQLIVTDDISGTTTVKVFNTGGLGAQTTEGIQLIVAENSSDDAFALAGDYSTNGQQAIVGGAYAYRLHQGNASGSNETDWFLRSELKDGSSEYQAGAPVYEVYPQALLGLNGVSTLQQRVGNRVWSGGGNNTIAEGADIIGTPYAAPAEAGTAIEGRGIWARIEGAHNHMEPRTSTTGTDYNQDVFKLQAGLDGVLNETESGQLVGGVLVQYVHGKTKTKSTNYADGEISTDGYGFGGTLSWYNDNGFYVDGQAQATWYNSDLTTTALGAPKLQDGNDGFGYALSLEAGKRIEIDNVWSVTPQAQLVYSHVKFDDFTDAFGADVSAGKGKGLQGRLGLTLDRQSSWQNASGLTNRSNTYGIVNMYYEFMNGTEVEVADVSFASKNDRLWGGLGIGSTYNWDNDKYSIYGEGLLNTSLNNFGDSYSYKGTAGFRVKW